MTAIRFMVWNMEWLNDLFAAGKPARFRPDAEKTAHGDSDAVTIAVRKAALRGVLTELAPDVVVVVEGPSELAELQLFFDDWMPDAWAVHLQKTARSAQNVGIAVRKDPAKFAAAPITAVNTAVEGTFNDFIVDIDDDGVEESYRFERRPLYAHIHFANGKQVRVLGVHLKSKGIFSAYEWSRWWQVSDGNRRKILAQASHIRGKFIEPYLTDAATKDIPLIVCGDVNDGPGLDASEKRLFGSGIERLMANVWRPDLSLRNALFDALPAKDQRDLDFASIATTSFKDPIFNNVYHREWIDHVLYTPNAGGAWLKNARVADTMPDGKKIWTKYRHSSDHSPVMADIEL